MTKKVPYLLAAATMFIVAGSAVAGERDGAISISPFVAGYTFDGGQHRETAPAYGLRLGYDFTKHWGVEAVGHFLETSDTRDDRRFNTLSYRLDFLYNFMPDGPLVPYLAAGGGGITFSRHDLKFTRHNTDGTVNAGLGIKYFVTDSIALRGDARQVLAFEPPGGPKYNWEYGAGVTFLLGKGAPAATPAAAPVPAPAAPVPTAPVPTASLSATTGTIERGESTSLVWTSRNAVNCEIQPNLGVVSAHGGIVVTPTTDTDYTLACKGPGGTVTSTAHITVTAGATNVAPAAIVTMPQASAAKPAQKSAERCATSAVQFETGKAELPRQSYTKLEGVGSYLKDHPQVKAVIEGHTDNVGSASFNDKLSKRRAEEVKKYVVKEFSVDPSRLAVKAYGSSKPVAENATSDGRQMNRRAVIIPGCAEQ